MTDEEYWQKQYKRSLDVAKKIWDQHGMNPMRFPSHFLGRMYRINERMIELGRRCIIEVDDDLLDFKKMNSDSEPPWECPPEAEYVNFAICHLCNTWGLVSGGTGGCIACDGIVDASRWRAFLIDNGLLINDRSDTIYHEKNVENRRRYVSVL